MIKITIIYNQPEVRDGAREVSPDDKDTLVGVRKIYRNLKKMGYEVNTKMVNKAKIETVINSIARDRLIFNYCEWTGKNTPAQFYLLELLGRNNRIYTGCGLKDFQWSMGKQTSKDALKKIGIPLLKSTIYEKDGLKSDEKLNFPVIVKTTSEHCSIGLDEGSIVGDMESALKRATKLYLQYQQPIMIEEFAEGNEYQVFVFDSTNGPIVFPVYATTYRAGREPVLITFADNWVNESLNDKVESIRILRDGEKSDQIKNIAGDIFKNMNMRGYIRIDLREKQGQLYVLEVNTNPAISWTDKLDFVRMCGEAAGLDFQGLITLVLNGAKSGG